VAVTMVLLGLLLAGDEQLGDAVALLAGDKRWLARIRSLGKLTQCFDAVAIVFGYLGSGTRAWTLRVGYLLLTGFG